MVDPSGSLELSAMEQRVLGSLLEKQRTVPATYPMTVNSVRVACNQTSSRDPVVSYDEPEIEQCLRDLRHRDLIRVVHADRGQRTLKFHQLLDERLTLAADERAVLTVLLLRGPQTPGELKSRTDRLHRFADRDETEAVLHRLAGRTEPLVSELREAAARLEPVPCLVPPTLELVPRGAERRVRPERRLGQARRLQDQPLEQATHLAVAREDVGRRESSGASRRGWSSEKQVVHDGGDDEDGDQSSQAGGDR